MIKVSFVRGSSLRRVFIDGRKISLMAQETGFTPMSMDLDAIDEKKVRKEMGNDGLKLIKEIALLKTEKEMEKDIIKDFQQTGWRRFK